MRVKSIEFLSSFEDILDPFDCNLDAIVTLEDDLDYIIIIGTAKNLLTLMNNEKSDFLSPGDPIVIVRKMTKEIAEKAVRAYAEDNAYYLKFYAASLDTKTLDVLKNRCIARHKLLIDLSDKGESINIDNYDLIDFNIDNL